MAIHVTCANPHCSRKLVIKVQPAGKRHLCPACRQPLALPEAPAPASAVQPRAATVPWLWIGVAVPVMLLLAIGLAELFFALWSGDHNSRLAELEARSQQAQAQSESLAKSRADAELRLKAALGAADAAKRRLRDLDLKTQEAAGKIDKLTKEVAAAKKTQLDLPGASGVPLADVGKPAGLVPLKRIFLFFPDAGKHAETERQLVDNVLSGKLVGTYPMPGEAWSQVFPSGTKVILVGVAFSPPPPKGTKVSVRVLSNAGTVTLRGIRGSNNLFGAGEIISLMACYPASGAFLDGPHQIEVIINDVKCALLNFSVGN
jgi:hypothetical protein